MLELYHPSRSGFGADVSQDDAVASLPSQSTLQEGTYPIGGSIAGLIPPAYDPDFGDALIGAGAICDNLYCGGCPIQVDASDLGTMLTRWAGGDPRRLGGYQSDKCGIVTGRYTKLWDKSQWGQKTAGMWYIPAWIGLQPPCGAGIPIDPNVECDPYAYREISSIQRVLLFFKSQADGVKFMNNPDSISPEVVLEPRRFYWIGGAGVRPPGGAGPNLGCTAAVNKDLVNAVGSFVFPSGSRDADIILDFGTPVPTVYLIDAAKRICVPPPKPSGLGTMLIFIAVCVTLSLALPGTIATASSASAGAPTGVQVAGSFVTEPAAAANAGVAVASAPSAGLIHGLANAGKQWVIKMLAAGGISIVGGIVGSGGSGGGDTSPPPQIAPTATAKAQKAKPLLYGAGALLVLGIAAVALKGRS